MRQIFLLLFLILPLSGSGTYKAPSVNPMKSYGVSNEDLEAGEALFKGNSGEFKGQACGACHEKGQESPFKRSNLKKLETSLGPEINQCVADSSRAGLTLTPKNEIMAVGAYIVSRYKLNKDFIEELKKFTAPQP